MRLKKLIVLVCILSSFLVFTNKAMKKKKAKVSTGWNSMPVEIQLLIITCLFEEDLEETRKNFKNMALTNHEVRELVRPLFNQSIRVKHDLIKQILTSNFCRKEKDQLFALAVNRITLIKDIKNLFEKAHKKKYFLIVQLVLNKWLDHSQDNNFALCKAIEYEQNDAIALLLDNGADPNLQDIDYLTPLMRAFLVGASEGINLLIQAGADVTTKHLLGHTLEDFAASARVITYIRLFNKIIFDSTYEVLDMATLLAKISLQDKDAQQLFVTLSYTIDKRLDIFGNTALMLAAREGYTDLIKLFRKAGASINKKNKVGWTALMIAVVRGNEEMVRYLLSKKANKAAKNSKGETALSMANMYDNKNIIALLENKELTCVLA